MKQIIGVKVIFIPARGGHECKSYVIPELVWLEPSLILSDTLQRIMCIIVFNIAI